MNLREIAKWGQGTGYGKYLDREKGTKEIIYMYNYLKK